MKVVPVLVIGLAGTLAADAASAEWSGKGRIGGVIARGNTETATANLNVDVENELDSWKHKFERQLTPQHADVQPAARRERSAQHFRPERARPRGQDDPDALARRGLRSTIQLLDQVLTLGLAVGF